MPPIVKPAESETKAPEPKRTPAEICMSQIQIILTQYNNKVSNIPASDPFWMLCNQYRSYQY